MALEEVARVAKPKNIPILVDAAATGHAEWIVDLQKSIGVNIEASVQATLDASVKYLAWDLGEHEIRVNAVSAGPVRTLAARSIAGFTEMESMFVERAPLRRHIDADDVAAAAAYLLSDDAKNVTGTTLYVDAGYHSMGM